MNNQKKDSEPRSTQLPDPSKLDSEELDEGDLEEVSGGIIVIGGLTSDPYPEDLNPQPLPPRQFANGQS